MLNEQKIFTILSLKDEIKSVERLLKIKGIDYDKSKVFVVRGNKVVNFTFVTNDVVFNDIVQMIGGTRLY